MDKDFYVIFEITAFKEGLDQDEFILLDAPLKKPVEELRGTSDLKKSNEAAFQTVDIAVIDRRKADESVTENFQHKFGIVLVNFPANLPSGGSAKYGSPEPYFPIQSPRQFQRAFPMPAN